MIQASRQLRREMIALAHALHERGWVANHDGNLSARLGPGRYLATPTATSKRAVDDGNLIEVDGDGKRLAGTARSFSEFKLHACVYERRPDVHAVIHAHPPHATAIACSGHNPLAEPFMPEAVVSIGATVPKVPFAPPGPAAIAALAVVVERVDAALLASHGVIAWGRDLEQAYLRLELVEHMARVAVLAAPLGGVTPLPKDALPALLQARARAGLGRAADAAVTDVSAARGGAAPSPAQDPQDLRGLIRAELARVIDDIAD
ncbi:MAG: hypothetical protein Tsb0020_49700 [Haliangiales bacterium]